MRLGWLVAGCLAVGTLFGACSVEGPTGKKKGGTSNTGGFGGADPYQTCEEQCVTWHQPGAFDYLALRQCLVCDACGHVCIQENPSQCPSAGGAGPGGAAPGGAAPQDCSPTAPDCAACVVSVCALEQLPNTTFAGHCADLGNICAANFECVQLNNCIIDCLHPAPIGGSGGVGGMPMGGGGAGGA